MEVKKLLLVDDEPLIRRSLEKTLFRAGFEIQTAGNCLDGLAAFEVSQTTEAPFSLAILDINMPNFDGVEESGAGLELLSRLIEINPDLPVIMLTAYDEVDKAKDAIKRGARSYFVKGRDQGLVDLINELLSS